MSEISKALSAAIQLIPATEKARDQYYALYNGDLYFQSMTGRSWFIIKSFIPGDSNVRLSFSDIDAISAIGKEVKSKKIDSYTTNFYSGRHGMNIGCAEISTVPQLEIPPKERFSEIDPLIISGRNIFNLMREGYRVGIKPFDGKGALILAGTGNMLAMVVGGQPYDIDFTHIYSAVLTAMAKKAKVIAEGDRIFYYLVLDGCEIYASTKVIKCSVTKGPMDLAEDIYHGDFSNTSDISEVEIQINDFLEINKAMSGLDVNGYAVYTITKDSLKVQVSDSLRREYSGEVPCNASRPIAFRTWVVSKEMVNFLSTILSDKENAFIRMTIDITRRMLIIRPGTKEEHSLEAYVVMSLSLVR